MKMSSKDDEYIKKLEQDIEKLEKKYKASMENHSECLDARLEDAEEILKLMNQREELQAHYFKLRNEVFWTRVIVIIILVAVIVINIT